MHIGDIHHVMLKLAGVSASEYEVLRERHMTVTGAAREAIVAEFNKLPLAAHIYTPPQVCSSTLAHLQDVHTDHRTTVDT